MAADISGLFPVSPEQAQVSRTVEAMLRSRQSRGVFGSSGTDFALITANDVGCGDVAPFSVQSVSTRARFPDMAPRGVLGGHTADLPRTGQIRHGCAITARIDIRVAGHGHELIDH
jgi:hypothetical protein